MTSAKDIRPPLDPVAGTPPDRRWRVEVVAESGSTNADVAARFLAGEPDGLVLAAEHQSAGRGRLDRRWVTAPRSSLTVTFLVVPPPSAPAESWPWLPLLAGVAADDAVRRSSGVETSLKWPNDLLAPDGEHKLGGILLERVERPADGVAAAVVGIGINCHQGADELPVPEASSLALEGAEVDRTGLLRALAEELGHRLDQWAGADPALVADYRARCATVGRQVRVTTPGAVLEGVASGIDDSGRLVVRTGAGEQPVGAGDVVHVRNGVT